MEANRYNEQLSSFLNPEGVGGDGTKGDSSSTGGYSFDNRGSIPGYSDQHSSGVTLGGTIKDAAKGFLTGGWTGVAWSAAKNAWKAGRTSYLNNKDAKKAYNDFMSSGGLGTTTDAIEGKYDFSSGDFLGGLPLGSVGPEEASYGTAIGNKTKGFEQITGNLSDTGLGPVGTTTSPGAFLGDPASAGMTDYGPDMGKASPGAGITSGSGGYGFGYGGAAEIKGGLSEKGLGGGGGGAGGGGYAGGSGANEGSQSEDRASGV